VGRVSSHPLGTGIWAGERTFPIPFPRSSIPAADRAEAAWTRLRRSLHVAGAAEEARHLLCLPGACERAGSRSARNELRRWQQLLPAALPAAAGPTQRPCFRELSRELPDPWSREFSRRPGMTQDERLGNCVCLIAFNEPSQLRFAGFPRFPAFPSARAHCSQQTLQSARKRSPQSAGSLGRRGSAERLARRRPEPGGRWVWGSGPWRGAPGVGRFGAGLRCVSAPPDCSSRLEFCCGPCPGVAAGPGTPRLTGPADAGLCVWCCPGHGGSAKRDVGAARPSRGRARVLPSLAPRDPLAKGGGQPLLGGVQ